MKLPIFNQEGKEIETREMPASLFGVSMNKDLLHQVVTSQEANSRVVRAHTKGRGEVRGGGRKPWRQKGTGRARHGSTRSPIWKGGGVTHGPSKEAVFAKKINKKMAARALAVALSAKAREQEVVLLDQMSFTSGKTKDASRMLSNIGKNKDFSLLTQKSKIVLLPDGARVEERALRNIGDLLVRRASEITARDVLASRFVVLPVSSVDVLEKRVSTTK